MGKSLIKGLNKGLIPKATEANNTKTKMLATCL